MNTPKAAYWFALALFAVAFHSEYQRGAFPAFHRAASEAGATMCRLATKAERTVALARLIVGRPTPSTDALLAGLDARELADAGRLAEGRAEMAREGAQDRAEMMREQVRDQARAQVEIVRAQVDLQRAQVAKVRLLSRSHIRISNAVDLPAISVTPSHCPQSAVRVEVPSINLHMSDLRMNDLRVNDLRMDESSDNDADSR